MRTTAWVACMAISVVSLIVGENPSAYLAGALVLAGTAR